MCLISVIVPVYNVEKYLPRCIESILNQTYRNFELILVDDGSTDRSGQICDEYKVKDERIRVLHKPNGGQSEARNEGIEQARGEYINFFDADDFAEKDILEYLISLARKYNADLVVTAPVLLYESGRTRDLVSSLKEGVYPRKEVYRSILLQTGIEAQSWGKLYKKFLFDKIRYPVGEIYEDFKIIHEIIEEAGVIVFGEKRKYFSLKAHFERGNWVTVQTFLTQNSKDPQCLIFEFYWEDILETTISF
jgi:glycosyltransferase involved in cell wall biosynthesis